MKSFIKRSSSHLLDFLRQLHEALIAPGPAVPARQQLRQLRQPLEAARGPRLRRLRAVGAALVACAAAAAAAAPSALRRGERTAAVGESQGRVLENVTESLKHSNGGLISKYK